jgi:Ni/Fe-hydrogenase subunit HybB-like protein
MMNKEATMANHHQAAPLGGRLVTPTTVFLGLLVLIAGVLLLKRFVFGMGSVANMNDGYPWGIWVAYDVVVGSALACGGYSMALLVYIFNKGEYHPLVRPALMGSIFGYTLAGVSVIFDLGRYWNFWHIFWPGYSNVHSVMFEVALCISIYIAVMWIELSPAFLEKLGMKDIMKKLNRLMFFFIALGVLLPSMHQSSLGSLLVVMGYQVNAMWQTPLLPVLYLLSAITMGFAVVIFEAALSSQGFKRPMEMDILPRIANVMKQVLIAYLVVRIITLVMAGGLGNAFKPSWMALWFWIEMALFIAPIVLLATPEKRRSPQKLFLAACAMILAGSIYRFNGFLVGYETGPNWHYFPALQELLITIGVIAFEILAYIVFVRRFPILPREEGQAA